MSGVRISTRFIKKASLTRSTKIAFFITAVILLSLILAGCRQTGAVQSRATAASPPPVETAGLRQHGRVTASLALVGDIMVHQPQLSAAYNSNTGAYSFDGFFSEVGDYLRAADLTIGNLETTLAGRDKKFTGYPQFNSPEEILPSLRDAGVDVLTTANNHSLDRGSYGVLRTIKHLDAAGIRHTGTASSPEEREKLLIIDVQGIRVGILAYTYGTNGIPIPHNKQYLVNILDLRQVREDISKIRQEGGDLVLVYPHFGVEYRRIPGLPEKELVEQLFSAGADIVAGSHPHVLQPMVRRDTMPGAGGLFAAYSLGNFVSAQRGPYREAGVILHLKVEKDLATGKVMLTGAEYIPTWVHRYREKGKTMFRVLAVEKALRDYRQGLDKKLAPTDYSMLQQVLKETTSLLSDPDAPAIRHM